MDSFIWPQGIYTGFPRLQRKPETELRPCPSVNKARTFFIEIGK